MDDNKFWILLWSAIITGVAVMIITCTHITNIHYENMAGLGYEKQAVVGYSSPQWRKAD